MIEAFLHHAGWSDAQRVTLRGDASTRRFWRLKRGGERAILMQSGGIDIEPFLRSARHLREIGLIVPEILRSDREAELVLMSDLGDDVMATRLLREPGHADAVYAAATDLLVPLQAAPVPAWAAHYDADAMGRAIRPAWDHYALGTTRHWPDVEARLSDLLASHADAAPVLLHRDFHAENLILMASGGIGLVDFQDALGGHPAYDLASLLQDARRDVPPRIEADCIARFCDVTGKNMDAFLFAYRLQAVQRHLRILGIFARLSAEFGKPGYMNFIPRVWMLLAKALDDPRLEKLQTDILHHLPPPSARAA